MKTVFDIETGPDIRYWPPILSAKEPDYDYWHENIRNKNMRKRESLNKAFEDWSANFTDWQREKRDEMTAKAALDAKSCRVLAIGFFGEQGIQTVLPKEGTPPDDGEKKILKFFWDNVYGPADAVIGFFSNNFDLPVLIRRSWKHNITVPAELTSSRFFPHKCVDLEEIWSRGSNRDTDKTGGLDELARFFGIPGKTGDGAQFASLLADDRPAAIEYLRNDIRVTVDVARQMGVLPKF